MILYYLTWVLLRLHILRIRGREELKGLENIPRTGACIVVVANHKAASDPWRVGDAIIRRRFRNPIRWLAKQEYFSIRATYEEYRAEYPTKPQLLAYAAAVLTVLIVKGFLTIPVDRVKATARINRQMVMCVHKVFEEGGIVGLFGEGGIHDPEKGFCWPEEKWPTAYPGWAKHYGVPILPARLTKQGVVFGAPIAPADPILTLEGSAAAKAVMAIAFAL